ncbi:MAG: DUF1648 domain-containing protein [Deltaproteobacteria bacterium]|uniref:DUF1648 domain-containing protein n=1 Tax=Candidatus Zymogenus saltonus TaxID=2844893 RepID=A0A9D8PRF0_9DELT|nr:DUF1648 domain-containing protein [Candidatus Zymogenus saltonus]
MYLKVFKYHLPALIILGIVALIGYYAYPHLPDLIPTHFDIAGNPDHYSEKGTFGPLFFVILFAFFLFILAFDLFYFSRMVEGKIMAATNWGMQGIMAVIYLSTIAYPLGIIDNFLAGMAAGLFAMGVVFTSLYLGAKRRLDDEAIRLESSPYFERVKPSLLMRLIFFVRPYLPNYIIQTKEGLRILGTLYDLRLKWDEIEDIRPASPVRGSFSFVKLSTKFTGVVEIVLRNRRSSVIITPEDREAFVKCAKGFLSNG